MNLSGDYTLDADVNVRIPLYSNIRLTLLPNLKAYHVTWTGDRDGTSSRNVDTAQAEQWVRERIWILKHPARIALPAGV